jgi:hypothetical protein
VLGVARNRHQGRNLNLLPPRIPPRFALVIPLGKRDYRYRFPKGKFLDGTRRQLSFPGRAAAIQRSPFVRHPQLSSSTCP